MPARGRRNARQTRPASCKPRSTNARDRHARGEMPQKSGRVEARCPVRVPRKESVDAIPAEPAPHALPAVGATLAAATLLAVALALARRTSRGPDARRARRALLPELLRELSRRAGRGDGPAAGSLRTPPADLTRIAARRGGKFPGRRDRAEHRRPLPLDAHGTREMPVWGEVFSQGIPDSGTAESIARGKVAVIVEYLKSIQVRRSAARPRRRGRRATSRRARAWREIFAAMRYLLPLSLDAERFEDPLQRASASAMRSRCSTAAPASLADHGRSQEVPFAHLSRSLADRRARHPRALRRRATCARRATWCRR